MRTIGPAVVIRAPAKVNLFLEILARRPDNYHDIATLMLAIRLFDTLVFHDDPQGNLELHVNRPDLTTGPDNLILKAAHLLRNKTGSTRGAKIRLVKRIPMAAGLAGGSTDAAATLAGLNELWQLGRTNAELAEWSGEIGSDIPFFFHTPAAWCTGRGEKVRPVSVGRPLHLVLVCPRVGLATAAVYKKVKVPQTPERGEEILKAIEAGDVEGIGAGLFNRLQEPAQEMSPAIATWYERLRSLKPAGQLMSGSGSSLFALCRDPDEARALAREVRSLELRSGTDEEKADVYLVRSCS